MYLIICKLFKYEWAYSYLNNKNPKSKASSL